MSRKEELIRYINLLMNLKDSGFKCDDELNQAVKELNNIMFANKPSRRILVLESDIEGVLSSYALFEDIMPNLKVISRHDNDFVLNSENTKILIYKIDSLYDEKLRGLKGLRVDYIINNTDFYIPFIRNQLGIRVNSKDE